VDIVASATTVGAHKWEECRNNVVNTWELESSSIDDDDEEPVELGKSNLSLLQDSLAASDFSVEFRDNN
jgi:hypothetical protein